MKEVEVFGISLKTSEALRETDKIRAFMANTDSIGLNSQYKDVILLYETKETRDKAWVKAQEVFSWAEAINKSLYVPLQIPKQENVRSFQVTQLKQMAKDLRMNPDKVYMDESGEIQMPNALKRKIEEMIADMTKEE